MDLSIDVRTSGPLFRFRSRLIIRAGLREARKAVAERGKELVLVETAVFKAPTGRWASGVHLSPFADVTKVEPNLALPYNRWLEGVSHRNMTTRFKGYRLFRNAHRQLKGEAQRIATEALRPAIRRLNG
mgnify:CR=1 FL=1